MEVIKVVLSHNNKKYDVEVNLDDEVELFKLQLYSLTTVPVDKQKILGIKGFKEDVALRSFNLKTGHKIILMGPTEAQLEALKVQSLPSSKIEVVSAPVISSKGMEEFSKIIEATSASVQMYENPTLQEKARSVIPVDMLRKRAENNPEAFPSSRDELFRQLLIWFKREFFKWVDTKPCTFCQGKTVGTQVTAPTAEELKFRANRVEVHKCTLCETITRFPRYNDPGKLLETREGRCGEWANCFTLLCRAMGFEARYVLDRTDHVWTEVWSEGEKKWWHSDPCESALNTPLVYEVGWGKKLNYVLAFSKDEVVDVTKRYTKDWKSITGRRTSIPEDSLVHLLKIHNEKIRSRMTTQKIDEIIERLKKEIEEIEAALIFNSSKSINPGELGGRTSGSQEWRQQRGEMGACTIDPTIPNNNLDIRWADETDSVNISAKFSNILFNFEEMNKVQEQLQLVGSCKIFQNRIRITSKQNSQTGACWFKNKINLKDGFTTTFNFQVTDPGADGFAFVIHDDQNTSLNTLGEGGAHLGYGNIKKSLAIEFDTYQTVDRTLDPNGNHISIQSKGKEGNSADHTYSHGCSTKFGAQIADGNVHTVKIVYSEGVLRVYFDVLDRPILKAKFDIVNELGSSEFWIGFTGATGGLSENHDVLSWKFNNEATKH